MHRPSNLVEVWPNIGQKKISVFRCLVLYGFRNVGKTTCKGDSWSSIVGRSFDHPCIQYFCIIIASHRKSTSPYCGMQFGVYVPSRPWGQNQKGPGPKIGGRVLVSSVIIGQLSGQNIKGHGHGDQIGFYTEKRPYVQKVRFHRGSVGTEFGTTKLRPVSWSSGVFF